MATPPINQEGLGFFLQCNVESDSTEIIATPPIKQEGLGFFLQCNAESDSTSWSCNAAAELKVLNQKPDGDDFQRKIQHLFCTKEDDRGYSDFLPWKELLDPDKGYCKDDRITLQVHVIADAPHGVSWD